MTSSITGMDQWKDRLRGIRSRTSNLGAAAPVIDENASEQWRLLYIPTNTGELARSLRNAKHPMHVMRVRGTLIQIGTKDRAGRYQSKRIQKPIGGPMLPPLSEWITTGRTDGGSTS